MLFTIRRLTAALAFSAVLAVGVLTLSAGGTPASAAAAGTNCSGSGYSATRDPANPLALSPAPPAGDPLRGAKLWTAGPSHSAVAGAILHVLGIDTGQAINSGRGYAGFSTSESWASFAAWLTRKLPHYSPQIQAEVHELEKSAQPAAIRISSSSGGGSPSAIGSQMRKFLCTLRPEDPGSIMELSTYFLQPTLGGCATTAQINAYAPTFRAQIDAVASAIGRNPLIIVAEEDAVGASHCMASKHSLGAWEALLKYEVTTFEALPHTAVYLEGGYSDSENARYAASVLNPSGIRQIQGFFTNDTHFQWDSSELKYAKQVSDLTGRSHFIINTADNGRGPLLNHDKVARGVEVLCNPPGRGLGAQPTTAPVLPSRYARYPLDAFLWTYTPGFSVGSCNGGPANGQYWTALGVSLGKHANTQIGPGFKSQPW
jgi:hypothetical protein